LAAFVGPLAWFGAKYARQFLAEEKAGEAAAAASPAPAVTVPASTPAEEKGGKARKSDKAAKDDKREAKVAAAADAGARAGTESGESTAGSSHRTAEHEAGGHRAHATEKQKDHPRRAGPDLKDMMAPDPSLLPAMPPAAPSEPAPASDNP
jgi:hypothetical protein